MSSLTQENDGIQSLNHFVIALILHFGAELSEEA